MDHAIDEIFTLPEPLDEECFECTELHEVLS